jgi:hypothetical protein
MAKVSHSCLIPFDNWPSSDPYSRFLCWKIGCAERVVLWLDLYQKKEREETAELKMRGDWSVRERKYMKIWVGWEKQIDREIRDREIVGWTSWWTDGRTDRTGQADIWTDGRMNRRTDEQTDGQTDRQTETDRWMDKHTVTYRSQINKQARNTDTRTYRQTDRQTDIYRKRVWQTDRQTDKKTQKDGYLHWRKDGLRDRRTKRQTDGQMDG